MRFSKGTLLVAGAAALAVAAGGGAIAATKLTGPSQTQDAIIKDAAGQLGVTPAQLSNALQKAIENQIDAQVAAGQITKAEGDALKARIQSGGFPFLLGPRLFFNGGPGFFRGGGVLREGLDAAATYLNLTPAQLREQLASGKTLAQIATAQGKTADGLVTALTDAAQKKLDAAVAAGKLTKDQEAKMLAGLTHMLTGVVNGTAPLKVPGGFPGPAPFGFDHDLFGGTGAVASYLGLTEAQLRQQLEGGKTLAQIAKDQGKTVDGLVNALTADAQQRLDAAVKAGKLTSAQEQQILSDLKQHLTDAVNGTAPAPGQFGHRFFRGGGFFFHGGGSFRMARPPMFRTA